MLIINFLYRWNYHTLVRKAQSEFLTQLFLGLNVLVSIDCVELMSAIPLNVRPHRDNMTTDAAPIRLRRRATSFRFRKSGYLRRQSIR